MMLAVFVLSISLLQAQTTAALYITSPESSARVDGAMVIIQFEISPGVSANGIPEFRVQLDREAPVRVTDAQYVLYWLSPGSHTVTVSLVDANGTPIFAARNEVQFDVVDH